jgi:large subunit ribosomal protein L29
MKPAELRDKSKEELQLLAGELSRELFNLRFQRAVGSQENPMRVRNVKRDLARVNTLIREREITARLGGE